MPREMIQSPVGPYHVKVGWSQDRDVQVGVEADEGRSIFWLLVAGEKRAELGAKIREAVEAVPEQPGDVGGVDRDTRICEAVLNLLDVHAGAYQGLWADVDRDGANRLIRLLRRARDAAFGADA